MKFKKGKGLLYSTLKLVFIVGGFSQLIVFNFRPADIFVFILFLVTLGSGKFKMSPALLFFSSSFMYGWIIGGFEDIMALVTNLVTFTIMFSLIGYFKNVSNKDITKLLNYFNIGIFISNLIALLIFLFIPAQQELVAGSSSLGYRFHGFFNQSNGYGFVLVISFPLALYFCVVRKAFFDYMHLLLLCIALLLTQSRGALISLMIGYFMVYGVYMFRIRKLGKIVFPVLVLSVIYFVFYSFMPTFIEENFGINLARLNPSESTSTTRSYSEVSVSDFEEDRFYLVYSGLKTLAEYPFGLGFRPLHEVMGEVTGIYMIPHNYYLTLLLRYGLIFGLGWLLIIFWMIFSGVLAVYRRRIDLSHPFFYLLVSVIAVALFYLTHSPGWFYFNLIISIYVSYLIGSKRKFVG